MSEHLRHVAEQAAQKTTYVASGVTAGVGAWSLSEWAIAVGMAIAVLTYVTGLVFQIRRDRREEKKADAYLEDREK